MPSEYRSLDQVLDPGLGQGTVAVSSSVFTDLTADPGLGQGTVAVSSSAFTDLTASFWSPGSFVL